MSIKNKTLFISKFNSIFIPVISLLCLNAQSTSTWEIIQQEIWNPNCISCHVSGSTFAFQSDLILTSDVAYGELINVVPNNAAAASDGLLRVGNEGLSSLYTSFLWEKINAPDQEHFYSDHPYYGALMPFNPPSLTNGELSFIEQWILAGAPEEGAVVDIILLEDTTRYEPPEFEPLDPPDNGYQFHIGPFDVPPNYEREFLYYDPLDDIDYMYIKSYEIAMRPGSHHFIAYTFLPHISESLLPVPYEYRDIRDENGEYIIPNLFIMLFHKFGVGTQWPYVFYHFPQNTALKLDVQDGIDLNSHYVNRTDSSFEGEVYLNINYAEEGEIDHYAEVMSLNNNSFQLPPNDTTTLTKTFMVADSHFGLPVQPVFIFQMFSHAHEHMLEFQVRVIGGDRDGELIYIAYDWEHPPILELNPPLFLDIDQGLELETTYFNWTDDTLEFGLLSEDEMMILFGYLYREQSAVTSIETTIPQDFRLHQNCPNPFNPITSLRYDLPEQAQVTLTIYDPTGREVPQLVNATQEAGFKSVQWDATDSFGKPVSAGVYLYQIRTAGFLQTRKMVLLK